MARSLILLIIMTLIFAALIGESVVKKSIESLKKNLNQNFHAGFTVSVGKASLSLAKAEEIAKIEHGEKTNFQTDELLETDKYKTVEGGQGGINLDNVKSESKVAATFLNESSLLTEFLSGKYELKEGRHIRRDSEDETIIHEEFAKINNIRVGDEIQAKLGKKSFKLKVVGIFSGKNSQQTAFSSEMIENRFFVSFQLLRKIKKDTGVQVARYFVKDPKKVEETIEKAKKIELPWTELNIHNNFEKNAEVYQTAENVEKLLTVMLAGIGIVGVLVLGFVLLFWFRGRLHEIGTLMAIGNSKLNVFLQILVELVIITFISFVPATMIGNLSSGVLTETILEQANPDQSGNTSDLVLQRSGLEAKDYVKVYLLGMTVILLSIGVSSASIMRLTPKQILTKMK